MIKLLELIGIAESAINQKQIELFNSNIELKSIYQGFINSVHNDIANYKIGLSKAINCNETFVNFSNDFQVIMKKIDLIQIPE